MNWYLLGGGGGEGVKPKMTAARVVLVPFRVLSCLNRIMIYDNAFQNL